jgi:hypothetical protein
MSYFNNFYKFKFKIRTKLKGQELHGRLNKGDAILMSNMKVASRGIAGNIFSSYSIFKPDKYSKFDKVRDILKWHIDNQYTADFHNPFFN